MLYIGSITKTLAPTIRCGYLVADAGLVWQASKFKELMEIRGDFLMEEAIAYLFHTGEMQRHITRSVKIYKERRDVFCRLLKEEASDLLSFHTPLGGMAVWARFDGRYPLPFLSSGLAKQHIYMNDGGLYDQGDKKLNGIRLGFASMEPTEMERFIKALRSVAGTLTGNSWADTQRR